MTDRHERGSRFPRRSLLVLAAALALVLLSAAQLAYRFTLPTDGWDVYSTEIDQSDWVYWSNLVGALSGLEQDDLLLAVEGQSMRGSATMEFTPPPANWAIGRSVQMTVLRAGREISVDVPVVSWALTSWWRFNIADLNRLVDFTGALILFLVGLFTFLKRPNIPSAQALLMLCAAIFSASISGSLPDGLSVQFNALAFATTAFFSYVIFGTLLAPSLLAFTLLFPQPKRAILARPWLALLPYCLGLTILVALISGAPAEVGWLGTLGMIVASMISLVHAGLTQRDAVSRAQLRWAVGGFIVGLGLALLTFPSAFGWVTNPLLAQLLGSGFSLGITVIGVTLAVAVLRYRLFDIDVIIRKTLQYALLTGLLALVYLGSVVLLQSIVEGVSGQQSPIVIVISTLLIAALFTPLRQRVQAFIDQRFFRRKYNAEQALSGFAVTLRGEMDIERLEKEMLAVVQETMQPIQVSLWLLSSEQAPITPTVNLTGSTMEMEQMHPIGWNRSGDGIKPG
jgi:hypothetical protein